MRSFALELHSHCYLEVSIPSSLEFVTEEVCIELFLYNEGEKYLICRSMVRNILESLTWKLEQAVHHKLYCSFGEDIGYLYNQFFYSQECYENKPFSEFRLASASWDYPHLTTWLYNDESGQILLQTTELYYWFLTERGKDRKYVFYKTFIRDYKPLITWVIPHQVARKWLAQCQYALAVMWADEKRYAYKHAHLKAEGRCQECLDEAAEK